MVVRRATTRVLLVLAVLGLAGAGAWGLALVVADRRETREIEDLQERVRRARSGAETCQVDVVTREEAFRRFDARVDSLREAVRPFEELDERGVPEARYEAYLAAVARFNRAVEAWETRAAALQRADHACRETVERHNALADSLRERLAARETAIVTQPNTSVHRF
jgi:predicted  nucleic acid-binding Zn-ribbon protein